MLLIESTPEANKLEDVVEQVAESTSDAASTSEESATERSLSSSPEPQSNVSSSSSITSEAVEPFSLNAKGFGPTRLVCLEDGVSKLRCYLATAIAAEELQSRSTPINIFHIGVLTKEIEDKVAALRSLGWNLSIHSSSSSFTSSKDPILVLDELANPLMTSTTESQWLALQSLFTSDRQILWVTHGSQMHVTHPENAMIHGLCRTVRSEDPMARITTLDVESPEGKPTIPTIDKVLRHITEKTPLTDHEFVEREGIVYISRVLPNGAVNNMSHERSHGRDFAEVDLHAHPSTVRLVAERLGTLESLQFNEIGELPLASGSVEVELEAAGLNFKDLAITMGIVPENEHLLGLEGAGTVRRPGSTAYNVGDRVLIFEKGTFANRVIATKERVYPIPDWMSYEEAATLASVYLVSLHSLYNLANTKPGQRVLIHSATGGLGIACIQICKHIGAEVFATAGSEEKRKFLAEEFGIPASNIFNSRTPEFAEQIMQVTGEEGVDVIINSLTGELLDESWRCIREGGTMVELGKKDMLDRNNLSMEPFGRNVGYVCFDMAHKNVSDAMIEK